MVESLTLYCLNFLLILLALFLWITEWNIFIVCGVLLLIINLNNFKFVKFFNLFYFFSLLLYVFFDVNLIEKFLFFFLLNLQKFYTIKLDEIPPNVNLLEKTLIRKNPHINPTILVFFEILQINENVRVSSEITSVIKI